MARPRRTTPNRSTGDYRHDQERRKNNPPVGMVAYEAKTAEQPQAHYGYDPHLSPQLIWAGKPGLVSIEVEDAAGLEVDTVSLHIHERVSTQAIIHAVQKPQALQLELFADPRQPLGVDVYDPLTGRSTRRGPARSRPGSWTATTTGAPSTSARRFSPASRRGRSWPARSRARSTTTCSTNSSAASPSPSSPANTGGLPSR